MDENRVSGTAKNIGGKIEEGFGQAANDGPGFGVASPHRAGLRSG